MAARLDAQCCGVSISTDWRKTPNHLSVYPFRHRVIKRLLNSFSILILQDPDNLHMFALENVVCWKGLKVQLAKIDE